MTQEQLTLPEDILSYILGGHGTFTLESQRTGSYFTYKADMPELASDLKVKTPIFIQLLTPEPIYLGVIWIRPDVEGVPDFNLTRASRASLDAPSVKALRWLLHRIRESKPLDDLKVYHEGTCSRCGKNLTTPESIKRGIGPVCYSRSTSND